MRNSLVLWLISAGLCAPQTTTKNPLVEDAKAAEAGRIAFRMMCSQCHGIRAEGGRGPDLTLGTYSIGATDADLFRVIANGAAGTEMPGFSSQVSENEIWQLICYVRSVALRMPSPIAGGPQAGEKLFWGKGQCGQCHRVDGKGKRLGPDLSRCGRERSIAYLRESILDPSADLTPGYYTITVLMRNGQKIVGVQKGLDNFSVQLMDAGENYHSFLKSNVFSVKQELRSLMPNTYRSLFSDQELNDLLAYLASLRGGVGEKR
jgi:putative heme-binding domain-containing protein